jgi:hypothetical protein
MGKTKLRAGPPVVVYQDQPWVQQGGFAALAGLSDGLSVPKVA